MVTLYENATHVVVTGKPSEINDLVTEFRFRPEGYFYALSYQRYQASEGAEGWDGYLYPLFRNSSGVAKALRGRRDEIIRAAELHQFKIDRSHLLECPFRDLEIDDVRPDLVAGDFVLDLNQRQCILDWLKAGIGFNKISIGGGKTATFAGAAALIKERYPEGRFLYVTPSERLVRQATREISKFLPHFEIGQCGGGRHDFQARDMVICTVAMLNRHFNRLNADGWFNSFLGVLYDEVHHCASKTSKKVLMAIPAYFRLGASDTAKESDKVRSNDIRGLFGLLLNDVPSAPLIEKGRLARPHIYIVDIPEWTNRFRDVPYRPNIGSSAYLLLDNEWVEGKYAGSVYERDEAGNIKTKPVKTADRDDEGNWIIAQEPLIVPGLHTINVEGIEHEVESRWCLLNRMYDRSIIRFKPRNMLVVEWVKYFNQQGWPVVVVATRTTHVYILEALIQTALGNASVKILTGEASPQERDDTFDWFRASKGGVLITPLVKEGVSINEIKALVVADHVADYEVARQIIGRAIRPKLTGDNRAHIVWFWDNQHPVLRRGCAKIFHRLENLEGFSFYHPCAGPETVFTASGDYKPFASAAVT